LPECFTRDVPSSGVEPGGGIRALALFRTVGAREGE
jgi:hypothetical protein